MLMSIAHLSFLSDSDKGKKNRIKVKEKNKKLTCLQAAAEPWRQHDKVNGAPLRVVGGTQVSESTLPQG